MNLNWYFKYVQYNILKVEYKLVMKQMLYVDS